ncbi:MAG: ATP-binding protein [Phycisphaeraceae bacterium]|nr:ATP-binding protein [Phycisphaerales bacterium]MCB9861665.1 ATP-binding protein [Phycisphaeraceae bacterium]
MTKLKPHISIEFQSNPKMLCGVRELIANVAERMGFASDESTRIKLAVDEALANVIRHGYSKREDGPIAVQVWFEPTSGKRQEYKALRIVIEDEGVQIEPDRICGRDLDDIRPGGLGVHIIKEIMDEVVYEKRSGGGMRLTMVKHMPQKQDAAQTA